MAPTIAILGSLNIDFITLTPRLPAPGETLSATSIRTAYGGKGANQAVACARLATSALVRMSGAVGSDSFGSAYLAALADEGIDTSLISTVPGPTGLANVIIEAATGENRILLSAGANGSLSRPQDLLPSRPDVVVMQLEIPLGQVVHNARLARERGAYVLLNPAPATALPEGVWADVDCVVLNETEAEILCPRGDWETWFFERGVRGLVVLTLGGEGVSFVARDGRRGKVPARKVRVVDTTAAGDTFVGALAVWIAERGPEGVEEAIEFANRAAAVTVQREGAMDAIPRLKEVAESI